MKKLLKLPQNILYWCEDLFFKTKKNIILIILQTNFRISFVVEQKEIVYACPWLQLTYM